MALPIYLFNYYTEQIKSILRIVRLKEFERILNWQLFYCTIEFSLSPTPQALIAATAVCLQYDLR